MQTTSINIGNKQVKYFFDADFSYLETITSKNNTVIITDDNVFKSQPSRFEGWKTIVIKAGEEHKQQSTVDYIISELIKLGADRKTFVVGVGGGVVTDITGYAASVYMRGLKFGFVPTTILAMVDASIGGKNGVDVGVYKNLVGLIKQPDFLLFDYTLLESLPEEQWVNGFAEVIKHACIKDESLFTLLEDSTLDYFQKDKVALADLIEKNVNIKTKVVVEDEFEQGDRKLLNFGHTVGHAIENIYQLLHGHAISIGMVAAGRISEEINNFHSTELEKMIKVLAQYHLPTEMEYDKVKIWEVLKLDKKKVSNEMNFVLLNKIGDATVRAIPMNQLEQLIK
ncbi:3-dehydroquinate synthase [Ferruginibacter sp. SUN002]|uniref:3-dehydroquinate synthase n=1 Tax=Ferruginibacter sp. SUN002 TaxID=2937789 RepID=UPI003D36EE43